MNWGKIIAGVLGLIIVYSYRPPSGLGDALMMLGEGRNFYLKEPVYLILMAIFGLLTLWGIVGVVGNRRNSGGFGEPNRENAGGAPKPASTASLVSDSEANQESFRNFHSAFSSSSAIDEKHRTATIALVPIIGVCILVAGAYWYFGTHGERAPQVADSQAGAAAPQAFQTSAPAVVSPAPTQMPTTVAAAPLAAPVGPNTVCNYTLTPAIYQKWRTEAQSNKPVGCPIMAEADATTSPKGTTGRWVRLVADEGGGNILVMHTNGLYTGNVYLVRGCIDTLYDSLGGSGSVLGFPTSEEYNAPGGLQEDFEGGKIYWSAATHQCNIVA